MVVIDHGWGSRIFDPRGSSQAESYGANRRARLDLWALGAHVVHVLHGLA
jgi:formate dehydrogenase